MTDVLPQLASAGKSGADAAGKSELRLDFVASHERVFVIEQNRDAQLRTLLISEGDIDPARLVPILHYDGTPITARFIVKAIADLLSVVTLAPLRKALP